MKYEEVWKQFEAALTYQIEKALYSDERSYKSNDLGLGMRCFGEGLVAVQRYANPAGMNTWVPPPPVGYGAPDEGITYTFGKPAEEPKCPRCGHDGFKLESKKGYMCSRSFLCGHTWEDTP